MTLLDLDPKWLMFEGRRVGFIFRCPLLAKRNWWQTCFTECFPTFKGTGEARRYVTTDSQCAIVDASAPETKGQWQGLIQTWLGQSTAASGMLISTH
jgi:hypothetical protein